MHRADTYVEFLEALLLFPNLVPDRTSDRTVPEWCLAHGLVEEHARRGTPKLALTPAGKDYLYRSHREGDRLKWVHEYRGRTRRSREDGIIIDVPVLSAIPVSHRDWILTVNKKSFFSESPDIQAGIDHVLSLLERFWDALTRDERGRVVAVDVDCLQTISNEINEQMHSRITELPPSLVPNPYIEHPLAEERYTPPFILSGQGGIARFYASLAEYLSSPEAGRLKKCPFCKGFFIAPDDSLSKYCPGTNHRNRYWSRGQRRP